MNLKKQAILNNGILLVLSYDKADDIAIRSYYSVPATPSGVQGNYTLYFKNVNNPLDHFSFTHDFEDLNQATLEATAKAFMLLKAKSSKTINPISSDFFYLKSPKEAQSLIELWRTNALS